MMDRMWSLMLRLGAFFCNENGRNRVGAERQRPQQRCREAVLSWSGFRPEAPQGRACGSWVCPWPEPVPPGSEDSRPQRSQQGGLLPSWSVGKGRRTPGTQPVPSPRCCLSDTPCPRHGCSALPVCTKGPGGKGCRSAGHPLPSLTSLQSEGQGQGGGERAFYGDREPRRPGRGWPGTTA